jgi:hypothetical protein
VFAGLVLLGSKVLLGSTVLFRRPGFGEDGAGEVPDGWIAGRHGGEGLGVTLAIVVSRSLTEFRQHSDPDSGGAQAGRCFF